LIKKGLVATDESDASRSLQPQYSGRADEYRIAGVDVGKQLVASTSAFLGPMKIICPRCRAAVSAANVDVATDLGVCAACAKLFSIAALVAHRGTLEEFDFTRHPAGAWFEETASGWRIGASARSAIAFFHVPFLVIWSGCSLGFLYGSQLIEGKFDWEFTLFGLPFLYGTVWLAADALMSLGGKIVVTVEHDKGSVFKGIGSVGRTRRFVWSEVSGVEVRDAGFINSARLHAISLAGPSRVDFGSILTTARRQFLLDGLRQLLAERNHRQSVSRSSHGRIGP
jgi:hypothetical protein